MMNWAPGFVLSQSMIAAAPPLAGSGNEAPGVDWNEMRAPSR